MPSSLLTPTSAPVVAAGNPIAIRAEGLGKLYRIGATQGAYR